MHREILHVLLLHRVHQLVYSSLCVMRTDDVLKLSIHQIFELLVNLIAAFLRFDCILLSLLDRLLPQRDIDLALQLWFVYHVTLL